MTENYPDHTMSGRYMHDKGFDMSYPEKYLPEELLLRLKEENSWKDGQWRWGWERLQATRSASGAPKIKVASISWGQGYHTEKYWLPEEKRYIEENVG